MIVTTFLVILFSISLSIYIFYRKKFQHWRRLGILHIKPSFPFGNAQGLGFSKNLSMAINEIYKKYPNEGYVGFWLFFRPTLLIRDPEIIKSVFVRDFMSFHDRGVFLNEKADPLAANLFALSGQKWRNLRVRLTPTFSSGKIKMMFPIFVKCSENLTKVLDSQAAGSKTIDIKHYAACFTTDVISICAFGIETDSLHHPESDFRKYGQRFLEPNLRNVIRISLSLLVPDLAKLLNLRMTDEESSDFFMKQLRENMDYREANNVRRKDFLDLLIQLKVKGQLDDVDGHADGERSAKKFTFEEAAAQALIFFVAGYETSSSTMQFALYELAKNNEIQSKVRNEIKQQLERHNNELTYECVMSMDYLSRVVDETLRMYPTLPVLQRECNTDFHINGTKHILPKGNQVVIDVFGLHHDEAHFPNPDVFDPDRFTEEEKLKRHHYAYLPFGEGPRSCIGMRFGLIQTKVGIAALLSNFKFSLPPSMPRKLDFDPKGFILQSKGCVNLNIDKL